jgi:glycosyltransferase involved in cell wall biosynthesis
MRMAYEYALGNADGIIAQTEQQQANLRDNFGRKSTVVPNGYPTQTERSTADKREYFLWVGHLAPSQKRPKHFIELARRVPDAEFLLIGGRGSEQLRDEVTTVISSLKNINYEFDVPPDQIHQYYNRAIALINTSAHEGFPNTFLEAWRAGTRVFSLSVDPDRFLSQNGCGEFLAGDMTTLADRIQVLNSDQEYWSSISETVKRRFERRYSMDAVVTQYANAIERLVE